MQWGWLEPQVSTYQNEIGVCIGDSKSYKMADYEIIRSLYNEQDSVGFFFCEMISDCYAQDADNEIQETMRALAVNAEGCYISNISLKRMGPLQHRHKHLGVSAEDVFALLQRYKHGNESTGHTVQINDLWHLSKYLHDCLRATSQTAMRDLHLLLMYMPPLDNWTPSAADSAFGAITDCYSAAWEGCSQANPPSADEEMDKAVRWAMASALSTDQPVLTVMSLAYKGSSAFTKWLGHPLVHLLLKCKPPASGNDTLCIPADIWLEDQSVYKVRNKDVAQAMLVVLVAKRQGASEYCNSESLDALQASLANLEGIELARPMEGSFSEGGASNRSYARHKPRFRLSKLFPSKPMGSTHVSLC